MKTEELAREYKDIRQDYLFDPGIMCGDDDRVRLVKEIIDTRLSKADQVIMLLYADCQSYRKLGKRLGLSHMTVRTEVLRIRGIILAEYEKMKR